MIQVNKIKIIQSSELPRRFDSLVRFWDLAGTDGGGCYSVGLLLSRHDDRFFILDCVRGQWELSETIDQMRITGYRDESMFGKEVRLGWEEQAAAAGKFLTSEIQKRLRAFRTFSTRPMGSKEIRMEPVAASISYGEFHAVDAPWLPVLLDELEQFPGGKYLDQSDALSGGYQSLVTTKNTSGGGMVLPKLTSTKDPSSWDLPKCLHPECKRPAFGLQNAVGYCCQCCRTAHEWEEEVDKHEPECAQAYTVWWAKHSPVDKEPRTNSTFRFRR